MILDIENGNIIVRGPDEVLGTTYDTTLTPSQARAVADSVERDGHPVIADGLRSSADEIERAARGGH